MVCDGFFFCLISVFSVFFHVLLLPIEIEFTPVDAADPAISAV
jgi:hypothetical protein